MINNIYDQYNLCTYFSLHRSHILINMQMKLYAHPRHIKTINKNHKHISYDQRI